MSFYGRGARVEPCVGSLSLSLLHRDRILLVLGLCAIFIFIFVAPVFTLPFVPPFSGFGVFVFRDASARKMEEQARDSGTWAYFD